VPTGLIHRRRFTVQNELLIETFDKRHVYAACLIEGTLNHI